MLTATLPTVTSAAVPPSLTVLEMVIFVRLVIQDPRYEGKCGRADWIAVERSSSGSRVYIWEVGHPLEKV